jgi:hypothetical protein
MSLPCALSPAVCIFFWIKVNIFPLHRLIAVIVIVPPARVIPTVSPSLP